MEFDFNYKKNNNDTLFQSLENSTSLDVRNIQNYIPLYESFFSLSENNCNNVNLNQKYSLNSVVEQQSHNKYKGTVKDQSNNIIDTDFFFKFSPLIDPVKYMVGKYNIDDPNLLNLPAFQSKCCHAKTRDKNNTAYIDGFFTYLTSQLLNHHNFLHGIDFYGSFLCTQDNFICDVIDDLDTLCESDFFNKNKNNLFFIDSDYHNDLMDHDTRNYKKRLQISQDVDIIGLSDISSTSMLDSVFKEPQDISNSFVERNLIFDYEIPKSESSSSSCSSRSSYTNTSCSEDDDNFSEYSDSASCSTASDDIVESKIKNFPIQIICLERCHHTLDSLLVEGELSTKEWGSMLMQVVMMLITYQTVYGLTHNDLHTNNIMYIETEKPYLYYKYDGKHYKVPTHGKIFKIIDFGRAIYKFRGNIICSDSFHQTGDAATQYNFEPYFNDKKPRLEPNFSFDLCRLACSIFDFLIEELEDIPKLKSPIEKIIAEWCTDDKGRNILYKTNGDERYPEFKLYKMISRTVHKHTPTAQLERKYFQDKFLVGRKEINKKAKIMNIDLLPKYT